MKAWHYLINNDCLKEMQSREKPGTTATNSEKRRWLQNKSVIINDKKPGPDEEIEFPISNLVFFPKSNLKITML